MSASPPLPLPKRLPPGLWTGLVWFATAVQPIVEYVVMPPRGSYSLSYPRDGLDPLPARALLALAFVLALAGSAWLRRRPPVGFGLVLAGTVVSAAAWRQDEVPPLQFLGVDAALCYAAATMPRRATLTAAGAALGVLAGHFAVRAATGGEAGTASEPFVAATVVIAWLIGDSVRQARAHTAELHARAAAQAVTAERLRIAREMHDTVAHSIGIIALQAGAAARVVETQPARAREAMLTVEAVGRETLSGLRRMLGALRQAEQQAGPAAPDGQPGGRYPDSTGRSPEPGGRERGRAEAPPRPAAGLADVERLAATTTAAGVRVEVWWRGARRPLPPEIDLAAFRIVQEAVTNVVRHAAVTSCEVRVDYRDDELAVEVLDRGRGGGTGTDTGFGLVGMRERAALLHGHFAAGPRPGGGFRVAARLPLPAVAAVAAAVDPGTEAGGGAG
ncbi:sensor histidine kinase [Allostreptomyces psammosilenae]|uniref:histidine kinase n=1 Tax=Allostreptomyces psammosilenae TaxID=1892865 RepID=A0A853A8W8_9ACTN|nr:histidine kinase [Allostreptomyces psammosilenae]NYI06968.1 signal transduction histidine kinase [Allostreptomyces psammosilenae]